MKYFLSLVLALALAVPCWACDRVGFVSSFQLAQPFVPMTTVFQQPLVQQQVVPQLAYAAPSVSLAPQLAIQPQVLSVAPSVGYGFNGFGGFAVAPRVFVRPAFVARPFVGFGFGFGNFGVLAPRGAFVRPAFVAPRRGFIRIR